MTKPSSVKRSAGRIVSLVLAFAFIVPALAAATAGATSPTGPHMTITLNRETSSTVQAATEGVWGIVQLSDENGPIVGKTIEVSIKRTVWVGNAMREQFNAGPSSATGSFSFFAGSAFEVPGEYTVTATIHTPTGFVQQTATYTVL